MKELKPSSTLFVDNNKSLKIINTIFLCWGFITAVNSFLLGEFTHAVEIHEGSSIWNFLAALENFSGGILKFTKTPNLIFGFVFFSAYFFCGIPAGYLVDKKGLKQSIIIGLIVAASAVFILVPGARSQSYWLMMLGVFVQFTGFTILQVACNPYIIFVGKPSEGAARLSMAGAHNSFGSWLAPLIGTLVILADTSEATKLNMTLTEYQTELIVLPYVLITVFFAGMAVLIHFSDLPLMDHHRNVATNLINDAKTSIFQYRHVILGFFAIITYVCAEVMVAGLILTPYLSQHITSPELIKSITFVASYFAGCMMVGRFVGASILRNTKPKKALVACGLFACGLSIASALIPTQEAMFFILAIGLFNGIMWPAIFDITIRGMGKMMPYASALLIVGIVGAPIGIFLFEWIHIPFNESINNKVEHIRSLNYALVPVIICYAYIVYYAISGHKYNKLTTIIPEK